MRHIRAKVVILAMGAVVGLHAQDPQSLAREAVQLQQSGNYAEAANAYAELLKLMPNDIATHVNLGVVLAQLGRFSEAIAQYEAADKLLPNDPRIGLNLALAYDKSGQVIEAQKRFEALHAANPANAQVTMLLADSLLQSGDNDRVVQLLEPLKSSDDLGVAYMLGIALLRTQRLDEAQVQLDRILKNGDTAEARYLLGTRMFESGDYPAAVKQLASAAELNAKLPGLQSLYGRALLNTGDPDAAAQAFGAELNTDPNDFYAHLSLGEILTARKQTAAAQVHLQRALELRPQALPAQLAMAECLESAGDFAKALPYAKAAATLPDSHRVLASIYTGLHRPMEAKGEAAVARTIASKNDPGPPVNAPAPDFALADAATNKTVKLSDFKGKPVALIFGSYSCPNFRASADSLKALQLKYGKGMTFLLVYIREAHATNEWQSTRNVRDSIQLAPAADMSDKQEHATMCSRKLHLPFPALVDDMKGTTEDAYNAWPSRAYLIDRQGRIAYNTRLDELNFQPAEMEAKIRTLIQ